MTTRTGRIMVEPQNRYDRAASDAALAAAAAGGTPATTTVAGTVKQVPHIAALTAAPTMADFNNLLTALQTAGIMAAS